LSGELGVHANLEPGNLEPSEADVRPKLQWRRGHVGVHSGLAWGYLGLVIGELGLVLYGLVYFGLV
jgi:hypothetical protein